MEANIELCGAIEGLLRASDTVRERYAPFPGECDGVVLWDVTNVESSVVEFPGFSWLVSSQKVTPLRARFWNGEEGPEFEIRFGIAGIRVSRDELDRVRYGGRFPPWDSDWTVCLRS